MSYGNYKYDGFGGGYANYMGGGTAMGTMQTAAMPTQAVGTSSGTPFQRQAFSGNTSAMATQNVADMGQFKTVTPDALKTQPAGTYAYDAMATRPPQTQIDNSYGAAGCGTQNFSGYSQGGQYGQGYSQGYGGQGGYGQGYGQGPPGSTYQGQGYGGYQGYGGPSPGYDQTYSAYGGAPGYGQGQGGYGYGPGYSQGYGYNGRGYDGGMQQDMAAATQQLSAQQVYNRDVSGSFARGGMYGGPGGPGYNAYTGYPPGQVPVPMGRKPHRQRRSVCC
mmetsp:Transcript_37905/g.70695  ORF Transcript_37905/g.70695 Transcript_37905/m.70695 type:complete len:276 (+) Transcript_37905:69-896(+)